jgi:N-acetyl-gamma-glutamyl-phosphate reductase
MIRASIIGATGYSGIELVRILKKHPIVKISKIYTDSYKGRELDEIYPHLKNHVKLIGDTFHLEDIDEETDVFFIALPHGHAMEIIPELLKKNKRVIDLGADFRIKNPDHYLKWYHTNHSDKNLLKNSIYGLPELGNRDKISSASLIANPGCYPTAIILATLPLLKSKVIDFNSCIFDAKSGVSGAGRTINLNSHFCEVNENISAYSIAGSHRHTPEIEEQFKNICNENIVIQFTPHLIPVTRGMHVTAYYNLKVNISEKEIHDLYCKFYENETFIRISAENKFPQIKNIKGTNYCDLGLKIDERTNRLVVISVIDNLIKGASGQAIQNMNLMFDLPESMGLLENIAIYP